MSDDTNFETRLAGALQRRADEAPTTVDARAVTHAAAVAGSSAGARLFGVPGWRTARLVLTLALLAVLVAVSLIIGSRLVSPAPELGLGRLVPAGTMMTARGGQTATLLRDGRVLLVAGQVDGKDQGAAELYEPATDTFTRTGSLSTPGRDWATSAALLDGRVLIVGGYGQLTPDRDPGAFWFGEIYDPATGTFSRTRSMIHPRPSLGSVVTLPDGRVLIAGSAGDDGASDSVEFFDPATETFVAGGSLLVPRSQHTVTLLGDGRVLVVGGSSGDLPTATAEIYDPATGRSVPTGDLREARADHTASMLPDGRVLIVGGQGPGPDYEALASAELYDPRTGTFTPTGSLITERDGATAVTLRDGRVMVTGGNNVDGDPRTIEVYDPVSGTFHVAGTLAPAPSSLNDRWLSATLLDDGSVLLAGRDIATAERYVPTLPGEAIGTVAPVVPVGFVAVDGPAVLRTGHTATRLADGRVLIAGGKLGGTGSALVSAEIFDPATGRSDPTGLMGTPRSGHVAALLADGRVLIAGGLDEADRTKPWSSAELFDPANGTFSPAGPMTVAIEAPRCCGHRSHEPDEPSALTLTDGRILITGWDPSRTTEVPDWTLQMYDPMAGTFTAVPPPEGRLADSKIRGATLLMDGRVLILDGNESAVQAHVYEPVAGTWEHLSTTAARTWFTTTRLADGRVLIVGGGTGSCQGCHDYEVTAGAEIWDPVGAEFSSAGDMAMPRDGHSATLLPDGRVLVVGGHWGRELGDTWKNDFPPPEIWDPASGTFSPAGTMVAQRSSHTATLLDDGRVLLVGGVTRLPDRNVPDPAAAEVYVGP